MDSKPTDLDRCPLCGVRRDTLVEPYPCCECGLFVALWPQVARLVAIRDAAVKWLQIGTTGATLKLVELARQEAEKGAKDVRER